MGVCYPWEPTLPTLSLGTPVPIKAKKIHVSEDSEERR